MICVNISSVIKLIIGLCESMTLFFGGSTLILSVAKLRFSIQSIDKIVRQTSDIIQKKVANLID